MTENKLKKREDQLRQKVWEKCDSLRPSRSTTAIIISDSKGRYLNRSSDLIPECLFRNIEWWCKSGANIRDTFAWLKQNFDRKTSSFTNITVYLWLGTCDLTQKSGNGKIELCASDNSKVELIRENYKEIKQFLISRGCTVLILETPLYSIKKWNEHKGYTGENNTTDEDKLLHQQIEELNKQIEAINSETDTLTLKLNIDLQQSRTTRRHTEYYTNWKLLPDGIHPGPLVSRVWLLKIIYSFVRGLCQ